MLFVVKIVVSSFLIAFASWLAGRRPELAGFIIALPTSTMISLVFAYTEHGDAETAFTFAKSIAVALPLTLAFFVPFFVAQWLHLSFWTCYVAGVALIGAGYAVHAWLLA
jgi:uncharacterized membrane protein YczE